MFSGRKHAKIASIKGKNMFRYHIFFFSVRELAVVAPMLGGSQKLLNRDHFSVYYKNMPVCKTSGRLMRRHGDEMQRLNGGYYMALGRVDDTMNLGGIKVQIPSHPT